MTAHDKKLKQLVWVLPTLVSLIVSNSVCVEAQKRSNGSSSTAEIMGRRVSKTLRILSPLQSLTIFPKETEESKTTTPRDDFLPKFQAGMTAETKVKERLARRREFLSSNDNDDSIGSGEGWEKRLAERERLRDEQDEEIVEGAWDRATAPFQNKGTTVSTTSTGAVSKSPYQFVGVIQPPNSSQKVKWYARKRPTGSKWNIRMIHVNKDAIIRDMFTNGKVDVMGKYVNTGKPFDEVKEGEKPSLRPLIKGEYIVKPRSMW